MTDRKIHATRNLPSESDRKINYLLSASDPEQIPLFLDYVHGNIARQINKLRRRRGVFWSRRGAVIAVIDEASQRDRFQYVVAQGTAAGLVVSPKEWPGASSTAALLGDMRVAATYTSLDATRRNAGLKTPRPASELAKDVSFTLTPLPAWAHLEPPRSALATPTSSPGSSASIAVARAPSSELPRSVASRRSGRPRPSCARQCLAAMRRRGLLAAASTRPTASSATPTCTPPSACAPIRKPPALRSSACIRPAHSRARTGTSRRPPASFHPGTAATTTPTSPGSGCSRRASIPSR